MIPVNQTITNFRNGNCIQACVASIFELELNEVPNFMEYGIDRFDMIIIEFCNRFGLYPMDLEIKDNEKGKNILKGLYSIGIGLSPRGNLEDQHHGVVCYEGKIIHDPFENMVGLYNNKILIHTLFIVKDPSLWKF